MEFYRGKLSTEKIRQERYCFDFRHSKGFTLIELLISLSVVLFLTFFAFPFSQHLISKAHLELRKSDLLNTLKDAKLAAIRSNDRIIICRSKQSNICTGQINVGTQDWSNGWMLFIDTNNDRQYQSNETLIRNNYLNATYCNILWNRGDYLSFYKFATLEGAAKAGTFVIDCGVLGAKLTINWIGRVREEIRYQ